jgi:hypothetical protein
MRRLSRNNDIRAGAILVITGLIVLGHWVLGGHHHLPGQWQLILGIVLVVAGIPFVVDAIRPHPH